MSGPDPAPPSDPEELWDYVRELLDWVFSLFGPASDVAKLDLVVGARRGEMLSWLRPIERLARLTLLIMAVGLPALAPLAPRPARERLRRQIALDPDRPETWAAHFKLFEPDPASKRAAHGAPAAQAWRGAGVFRAWPLALRIEAVRRVAENPLRHARRLRRALDAKPARARRLARPPQSNPGVDSRHGPADFALSGAYPAALAAARAWDTS